MQTYARICDKEKLWETLISSYTSVHTLESSQFHRRRDPAAVDSLLRNAPDRVNLFIILFVPYPFSTLRTLIKTLSCP